MSTDPQRAQAVFLAAAEKPSSERSALLDRECNGDQELRHRVDALLKAHDDPGSFLDAPPPGVEAPNAASVTEQPGTMIGPYKLLEQIGEGGFGVVFLAEQERPVRRKVALKVIKPGMDTRQVIARFEAERQALAMMDHPNIARVLDAGATENGRPHFVMEFVQGVPITEYCDRCQLTTRERLELFITVCQAVQHAHQKGVIHRDVKPTNILIAMQNGKPAPKIIDFGVAKALNQPLTERTLATGYAQMIGTPLYMSPEQAELSPLGADTRSDIYSLGVLLYELLTGTTPFDKDRLHAASYDELRRILREEDPPRPSDRLSTLAADLATTIAGHRRTDARHLRHTVRGELDWIVMKCLEKDRNRRYESANSLARDIERYLHDEPVKACPPSLTYRIAKFARRRRSTFAASVVAVTSIALLLVGTVFYAWQQHLLATERTNLALDKERARLDAETKLYHALVGQASALRTARQVGYRKEVWKLLRQAAALNITSSRSDDIRQQVLASLGDPVGLDTINYSSIEPPARVEIPQHFQRIAKDNSGGLHAASPDGEWFAVARDQDVITLWRRDGSIAATQKQPLHLLQDLKYSPDGRLLVCASAEGALAWSIPQLEQVHRLSFRDDTIWSAAVHPSGRQVAALSQLGPQVRVWSLTSGQLIASLPVRAGTMSQSDPNTRHRIDFSADGAYLLGLTRDGSTVVSGWSINATPEKKFLQGHTQGVTGIAFSPDGRLLASVSMDRTVQVWDARSGKALHILRGHEEGVQSLAFSPDGRRLASGGQGDLRIWDPLTGKSQATAAQPLTIWRLQFDPTSRYLISGSDSGVRCWELANGSTGLELSVVRSFPMEHVSDLVVHPEATRLAFLTRYSNRLFWWDLAEPAEPKELLVKPYGYLFMLHIDRTGRELYFLDSDLALNAWDCRDGTVRKLTRPLAKRDGWHLGPAISPDDHWAALPNRLQGMVIYDLKRDREHLTLPPESSPIWSYDWSPYGRHLAVGLADGSLFIWNLDEVRSRLAEFGIAMDSTSAETIPVPATTEPLREILKLDAANTLVQELYHEATKESAVEDSVTDQSEE